MVRKIQFSFTNKWLYTFALIIGIFALAIGVYAVAPNPGHTWGEIGDVPADLADGDDDTRCDSSGTCSQVCIGTDCQTTWPSGGFDATVDPNGYLCYDTGKACTTKSTVCSARTITVTTLNDEGDCSVLSLTAKIQSCDTACEGRVACNGDVPSLSGCFPNGGTKVFYDIGSFTSCITPFSGTSLLTCSCVLLGDTSYDLEVSGGTRCI